MAVAQAKPVAANAVAPLPAPPKPNPAPRLPLGPPPQVVQRALRFDGDLTGRWVPDKKNCQLCLAEIGWNKRHHCRVCGKSVCSVCAGSKYQVSHAIGKSGRSATSTYSSERVCVDCVLKRKIAVAAAVPEFVTLQGAARTGAGNRNIFVGWERFDGHGKYSPRNAMIILDPSIPDAFSTYLFELTNAAQEGRSRRPREFDDPKKYGFYVELMEYNGTRTHQRVARAINNAHIGFRVTEMYPRNLPDLDSLNAHLRIQEVEHTPRYYEQWEDAQPKPVARRGSFSKEKAPERKPGGRRDSL